jgi:FixJ family two-component response regulator
MASCSRAGEGRTQSVAVVEDDAGVRKAIARLLRTSGYRVDTYASAELFLDRRAGSPPDCLVLDINLEGMSGLDLYERLWQPQRQPAVVFLTGQDRAIVDEIRRRAPGTECLFKPCEDTVLLGAIGVAVAAH